MRLFAICPGFGRPETDNKERILRSNIAVLRAFSPSARIRVCCYSPDYALPADIAASVEVVHEPGIVGQFLLKHAHPEELTALGCTHVAIILDDVELLPGIDLGVMLQVLDKAQAHIASPVLTPDHPSPWGYMNHQPLQPPGTAIRSSACEMFFVLLTTESYSKYYLGLDLCNPWCWGVDLTIQTVRGLWAVLFNDMQIRHWYAGGGATSTEHHAPTEEAIYYHKRGWTKERAVAAQQFGVFRYQVIGRAP